MDKERSAGMAAVVVGATAFGFLGLFSRYFMDAGLNALDTVVIRISIALLILTPILLLSGLDSLRISRKDIPIFLLFGFFKLMSDITFFYAQSSVTLCLATLLQMTAPFYVMFVSFVIFREKITIKKMVSLTLAIAGCIMVTGVLTGGASAEISGVLSALVSGLFFGMFMIGGRITFLRNIKPETGLFYTFLVAAVFALPFSDMGGIATAIIDYKGLFNALMLGGAMTLLPFYLYNWSVQYLEPTTSTMISVLEVVVAAAVGFSFFGERLGILNFMGMMLVIVSILVMNITIRIGYRKKYGKYVPPARKANGSKDVTPATKEVS